MLSKHFDPAAVEEKWRAAWKDGNFFDSRPVSGREDYCIMLPPPNVTGTLHMGHAFQHALMDALIRRARMRGQNALWQAGTDHAGIATQIVVERELAGRGIDADALSREEFLRHAWEWKEQSGGAIGSQMRRLGASCDWARERFTMDEGLSAAVREAFVRLYEEGLIYRGRRLVNWDPVMLTAVSDLEVRSAEEDGVMYYVKYPFADGGEGGIVIGTTRPETILVDGAVAAHPDDERYKPLLGRRVWVPMTDPPRAIEIIADSYVRPDFGTGCVKITAAHDFNDYEVYKRHPDKEIPVISLMTPRAELNENAPSAYRGLDRFDARKKIVGDLDAQGLLIKQEPHRYKLPRGDRSGAVIEPMLTGQWFMKMDGLAARALDLAERGEVRFVPSNWRKTYDQWLRNIQDWCLSRQLKWGHRIPAWEDSDGNFYVARSEAEAKQKAGGRDLEQSPDVLDTWFSSALWPFSTLDWPEEGNAHFRHYFPGSALVTGFDIIFFWVARMVMMSGHFTGRAPFRDVYITGLVRDSDGQKMSKSKGNVLDPLDLTDGVDAETLVRKRTHGLMNPKQADSIAAATRKQYPEGIPAFGADALRFTFASLASPARDIKFDLNRCAGYRNFCNKIWNAARFVLAACEDGAPGADLKETPSLADRWIVSRLQQAEKEVDEALEGYRFDLAAAAIYRFFWHEYCDWYLEAAKLQLRGKSPSSAASARRTLAAVLEAALRLLHPFMPFITEELWEKIAPLAGAPEGRSLSRARWPVADKSKIDAKAEREMEFMQAVVNECRRLRGEAGLSPAARPMLLFADEEGSQLRLGGSLKLAQSLAGLGGCEACESLPQRLPRGFAGDFEFALQMSDEDLDAMRERLAKQVRKDESDIAALRKTLADQSFLDRAPAAVVQGKEERLQSLEAHAAARRTQLENMGGG